MTIDEAIARERQQAKEQRNHIGTWDDEYSKKCEVYAEEHEQLAEWLELLKWYEQGMEDIPSESGVLPKDVYHAGYNKAIDDFKSRLEERILAGKMIDEKFAYIDNCDIDEIAEQLKAGGENENYNKEES